VDHRLRWALAPTDLRAKAAVLLGAVPLGAAVAAAVALADGGVLAAAAAGILSTALVLCVAAWLLAPRVESAAMARVERVRDAERELDLAISDSAPVRANVVIPFVDLPHFFGGHIGVFNLSRRIAEQGIRVRLVTADPQPRLPSTWRSQLERYEGLAGAFELLEVEFAGDGTAPLEVSPHDSFVAVSAWTSPVAHRASVALGNERFVNVIQDYDPLMSANGSIAAVAREAFRLPHYAVFSTQPLSDYFRRRRLGVFAEGDAEGSRNSVVFRSAITPVGPVTEDEVAARPRRSLLFYARPEEHAARNMFELGVVAISRAIAEGVFEGDWRFGGIGSVKPVAAVELAPGRRLELLPRTGQREYAQLLRQFSVGLALMDTPHPSLVPIEMASAGLAAVTSTYENKDAATLSAISANLIPAAPTVAGVTAALAEAVRRSADPAARTRAAQVDWPSSWDEAFDDEVIARVAGWLRRR
jgi:hypothetical protein